MQPYLGAEIEPEAPTLDNRPPANPRQDLLNLALIVLGFVAVLLLIPPQHEYPTIDDWIYAGSVRDQLTSGRFIMPPSSQANLVGLTLWGTAWAKVLGFSFTTLTYSTLVLALAGLLAFYSIARTVNVPPAGALLGTALLGFNPIFLHLSYSFMTDVPFLSLVLLSCYCYLRGLQSPKSIMDDGQSKIENQGAFWATKMDGWLWLGGLLAGYAFLIRQFGVLAPIGFGLYLLLDGLLTHHWPWRRLAATLALPALFVVGWYIWSRSIPPTPAAQKAAELVAEFVWKPAWIGVFLNRALIFLPLVALFSWAAVRLRTAYLPLVAFWAAILAWGVFAITLPENSYSFVGYGNIIRTGGLDFFEYRQEPIWTPQVWQGLTILGAGLAAFLLAKLTADLFGWLRDRLHGEPLSPITGFYLVGVAIIAVSLGLLALPFDRYTVGFLPFVILFIVRGSEAWRRLAWGYSVTALALLAAFSLLAQADFVDHDNARWQAGRWLSARAPQPIHVGYDWDNWLGYPSGNYEVTDIHIDFEPFRTEQRFPYLSRLSGFTTRYVLAESRVGAPPLNAPGQSP